MAQPEDKRFVTEFTAREVVHRVLDDPTSDARGLLNNTYARFVDENGNPLAGKHVVIKVSSTTGEILDIVAEA